VKSNASNGDGDIGVDGDDVEALLRGIMSGEIACDDDSRAGDDASDSDDGDDGDGGGGGGGGGTALSKAALLAAGGDDAAVRRLLADADRAMGLAAQSASKGGGAGN
jgi:hypothetical protein